MTKLYDKSENDLKALQSVGQIVGEVLKQLTEDKCKYDDVRLLLADLSKLYLFFSHCQGNQWPTLCGRLPSPAGQG